MCPTCTGRGVEVSVPAAGDPPVGEKERKGTVEVSVPAAGDPRVGEKERKRADEVFVPAAGDPPVGEIPGDVLTSDYHVFINHRGRDAKDTVASLVYHNLTNKGLKVFLDNKAMKHGESIGRAIPRVIRTAWIHIAIFSKHYAGSIWCLTELLWMLETGEPIIPIFCGVEPRDLREKGIYSAAFQKHLDRGVDSNTVDKWKRAVKKVSATYGFVYEGSRALQGHWIAFGEDCRVRNEGYSKISHLIKGRNSRKYKTLRIRRKLKIPQF